MGGQESAHKKGYEACDEKGHEGHEIHEGNEEGEEGQHDCEGAGSEGCSAQRKEGKDERWTDSSKFVQEQSGQGCVQEEVRRQQKDLRLKSAEEVVRCRQASTKGLGHPGFLRCGWLERQGQGVARQGE